MRKLLVVVLAAVASVLFVPAAYAGTSSSACSTDGDCAAYVEFDDYGEHLYAHDQKADGHGVYVFYTSSGGPNGEFTNRNGAGSVVDHNLSLPEGTSIEYQVCQIDGNDVSNCSGWTDGTA